MLVGQRTQAINALRGHAAEFGVVAAKGEGHLSALRAGLATDEGIPDAARSMFERMGQHIADLDAEVAELDQQLR